MLNDYQYDFLEKIIYIHTGCHKFFLQGFCASLHRFLHRHRYILVLCSFDRRHPRLSVGTIGIDFEPSWLFIWCRKFRILYLNQGFWLIFNNIWLCLGILIILSLWPPLFIFNYFSPLCSEFITGFGLKFYSKLSFQQFFSILSRV